MPALFIHSHFNILFNWFSDVTSNGLTGWRHRRRPVPFGPGHTGSGVAEKGSSYGAESNCGWHSERLANPILILDVEMRIESHCDLFLSQATGLSVGLARDGSAATAAKTDQSHEQSEQRQDEQAIHVVSIRLIYAKHLWHLLYTAKNQGASYRILSEKRNCQQVYRDAVIRHDLVLSEVGNANTNTPSPFLGIWQSVYGAVCLSSAR